MTFSLRVSLNANDFWQARASGTGTKVMPAIFAHGSASDDAGAAEADTTSNAPVATNPSARASKNVEEPLIRKV